MKTVELEIGEKVIVTTPHYYPLTIKIGEDQRPLKDELVIETRTIEKLEELVAQFEEKLEVFKTHSETDLVSEDSIDRFCSSVDLPKERIKRRRFTEVIAACIGYLLFEEILLKGKEKKFQAVYKELKREDFRLRLIVRPRSLRRWPWGFIWDKDWSEDKGEFLGILKGITISHNVFTDYNNINILAYPNRPIRMLFAVATPPGPTEIAARREQELITAALNGWCRVIDWGKEGKSTSNASGRIKIEIHIVYNLSWKKLEKVLKKHQQQFFDIFHFVGHGRYSKTKDKYCLVLEEPENGRIRPDDVPGDQIGQLLKECGITLVVLNSCSTSQERNTAEGIVQTMVSLGIPAAIGMSYLIRDEYSLYFSQHLFAGLFDQKPLDSVVGDTRTFLSGISPEEEGMSAKPIIYEHPRKGPQYLYPTIYIHPWEGCIFVPDEHNRDQSGSQTELLKNIEEAIGKYLHTHPKRAENFLRKNLQCALGLLWFTMLSCSDTKTLQTVARLLGETGNELAVSPLVETLTTNDDQEVQKACTEALKRLVQQPTASGKLVDRYIDYGHQRIFGLLQSMDTAVAVAAVWLRNAAQLIKSARKLDYQLYSLEKVVSAKSSELDRLIADIGTVSKEYELLREKEQQLNKKIDRMDHNIDREIADIREALIKAIVEREKTRREKDEIDDELNSKLDKLLKSIRSAFREVLAVFNLAEFDQVIQSVIDQIDWVLETKEELPNVPSVVQEKINDRADQLGKLRANLHQLLVNKALERFSQTIQSNILSGFDETTG